MDILGIRVPRLALRGHARECEVEEVGRDESGSLLYHVGIEHDLNSRHVTIVTK